MRLNNWFLRNNNVTKVQNLRNVFRLFQRGYLNLRQRVAEIAWDVIRSPLNKIDTMIQFDNKGYLKLDSAIRFPENHPKFAETKGDYFYWLNQFTKDRQKNSKGFIKIIIENG